MGEGSANQGDVHEGLNFAGDPQAAVRLRRREQRLRDQRPDGPPGRRSKTSRSGRRLQHARRDRRWRRRARVLRRRAEAVDARGGRGPTLIEAKVTRLTAHSSDDQQTKYRTAEELEAEKARDPLPIFRDQLREARRPHDEMRRHRGRGPRRRRGRDRLRRGAARPGSGDRAHVYARRGLRRGAPAETPPAWGWARPTRPRGDSGGEAH